MHVARTSARYSAVSSATKSLLYVASRLYSCDLLRDRPLPRFCSPARVPVPEFAELGKAFRILRCFHAAVSMGDAVDPRRCGWAAGMGAVDPPDSISSSRTDAPLRCIRRVRLSLAFCLRMCRIPRDTLDTEELLADAADSGSSSDDPWKDDHASTLAGRVRDAAVAARARAAVDTDGIPIFKKNKNEHISSQQMARCEPAGFVRTVRTRNEVVFSTQLNSPCQSTTAISLRAWWCRPPLLRLLCPDPLARASCLQKRCVIGFPWSCAGIGAAPIAATLQLT